MQQDRDIEAPYDPRAYAPVAVTVDIVTLTVRGDDLCVLLIQRPKDPFKGKWALPGTFVKPVEGAAGGEWQDLEYTVRQALLTKAGLDDVHVEQLRTYGKPGRDPRMRVITVAYLAFGPDFELHPGFALWQQSRWFPIKALPELAFDHEEIINDGVERARSKLEWTTLATKFLAEPFTIADLRRVYEAVWGTEVHPGNFHRKALTSVGFVAPVNSAAPGLVSETTTATRSSRGSRGHLFAAGDSTTLYPPIMRPETGVEATAEERERYRQIQLARRESGSLAPTRRTTRSGFSGPDFHAVGKWTVDDDDDEGGVS